MEDKPMMFQVDAETINDLSQVVDALIKYQQWLIERKDLEATHRLMPIVKKMNGLLLGILEDALIKYQQWLLERKDLEASEWQME